jgi:G3E family GTPase
LKPSEPRIPISIVTGFLGSGKTTVLMRLLAHTRMSRTAVLVNEFGEIGIDDVLLSQVSANVVLLESGCICCTIGDDLSARLLELLAQREAHLMPPFERVIVETTGLADPAPLLQNFMAEPLVAAPLRMAAVITTVDAVNGARQLDEHVESVKQAAVADRLLVTKTDLVEPGAPAALVGRLQQLNPSAALHQIARGEIEPDLILDAGLWNAQAQRIDIERWLNVRALTDGPSTRHGAALHASHSSSIPSRHEEAIDTFTIRWEGPVRFDEFSDVIEKLVSRHGEGVLRIKGILDVQDSGPVVVQGVQSAFYPPIRLASWPAGADRASTLVFITRNISRELIESEFPLFAPKRYTRGVGS